MGEEEKKPEQPPPAPEKEKKDEPMAAEKPAEDAKKEEKKPEEPKAAAPPPPPQEIVLKVYMHCEGCARKVRRCLKGFDGVEDVKTDCRTSKVVVKGEKADPLKVLARVQRKSHRQVELISPLPPPPSEKPQEKEAPKAEEKKVEVPVITVVLGVYMHCEACAEGLKKRIQRLKGVESVNPDLKSSQVTIKGAIEAPKLAEYIHKRMGKHATIIKVEPETKEEEKKADEKKEEEKPKEEKKPEEPEKEPKKDEEGSKDKKDSGDGGGEPPVKAEEAGEESKLEVKKNELQYYHYQPYPYYYYQQQQQQQVYYPQRYVQEYQHEYPAPQMFSDENPNACSVM